MAYKFLTILACLACLLAILLSLDSFKPLRNYIIDKIFFNSSSEVKVRLFTKEELSKYKGSENSNVYLSIIGEVYDVTKGRKHYGVGGGYSFFTGIDGTRAFVSGDFTEKGLIEDTKGLSYSDLLGIEEWNTFYKQQYTHIGRLIGLHYDEKGNPTAELKDFYTRLEEAKKSKLSDEDDKKRYPPCNFEYKQGIGRRIWCSNLSGGVQRDWAGVPRQYFQPGKTEPRCACVKDTGLPSDKNSLLDKDRGDLDNPLMKLYEGCDPTSFQCHFKE